MSDYSKIIKRRVMVSIEYRESERGPLKRDVYWYRVLPKAVYDRLLSQMGVVLNSAEKMCLPDWDKEFNRDAVYEQAPIEG